MRRRRQPNKLRTLPQVLEVRTLLSFVPQDQDKKLGLIRDLNRQIAPGLAETRLEQAADRRR